MSILSSILSTSKYIYTHSKQTRTDTQTHTTRQSYIYIATVTFFSSFARLLNPLLLLVETCNIRHYPPQLQLHTYAHIPRPFFIFSFPCSLSFFRSALLYDDSEGLIHTELYSIHDTCCWRWIYILFYFVLVFLTLVWCSEEGKSYYYD